MFKQIIFSVLIATAFGLPKPRITKLDGRIVGGEVTTIEEYPYQVSVLSFGSHICGGAIIQDDTILTAGHCVYELNPNQLTIRAGSSIKNSGGVVIEVKEFIHHSYYNPETLDFDIAILKLADTLNFGESISPIELRRLNPDDGSLAQVTGWGRLVEGGGYPTQLQVVSVPIVNIGECAEAYDEVVTLRMICAGYPDGGKDACTGDSGGPLVFDGLLVGLASWGRGCARPNYPGVYSNVPVLYNFIIENL